MIVAFCLLGAVVVFLSIVVGVLYFQIVRPLRTQVASIDADRIPTSRRVQEVDKIVRVNHLDVREDVVRLARRVDELEDLLGARPTIDMNKPMTEGAT